MASHRLYKRYLYCTMLQELALQEKGKEYVKGILER